MYVPTVLSARQARENVEPQHVPFGKVLPIVLHLYQHQCDFTACEGRDNVQPPIHAGYLINKTSPVYVGVLIDAMWVYVLCSHLPF